MCYNERKRTAEVYAFTEQKEQIFEDIYAANHGRIYLFLFKMSGDKDLSEELTQETFLRAFQSFDKYRGESSVYTWLVSIAKHTYFSYMKKKKLMMDSIPLDEAVNHFCANKYNLQNSDLLREDIYEAMHKLVYELPDNYKEVVLLRIYAEMSFQDVAITLGISEGSAKVLYFRAKNKLKERLKNELELQ